MNQKPILSIPEPTEEDIHRFLEAYRGEIKIVERYEPCVVGIEIKISKWHFTNSGLEFEFATEQDAELFAKYKDKMPITLNFDRAFDETDKA